MDKPRQVSRVPLTQIRPSRNNPRRIKRQDMIDARAASMAQSGQSTPIKIRPLTPEEKAQEPNPEILYEIIDGELRYWAAKKNGDKEIDAFILNMTPEEAFEEAIRSNRIQTPGWFEDYLAMEQLVKAGKLQKQQIAALFEVRNTVVGRALQILEVLNQASRELVLRNQQKTDGQRPISENALYRLADLGDEKEVEKALPGVLEGGMTEPQVRKLVEAVKGGQQPEDYSPEKASKTLNRQDAKAPRTAKTTSPTLAKGDQGGFSSSPQPALDGTPATPQDPHSRFKLFGHALGSAFHWVGHNSLPLLKTLFGWGKREAVKSIEKSIKHDIKHWVGMAVKASFLFVLMAVGLHFLYPGSLPRLIAWFMNVQPPRMQTGLNHGTREIKSIRVEKNARAALDFAGHYYGADYMDLMAWMDFLKKGLTKEVKISFLDQHFSPDWFQQVDHQQWIMSFEPAQPVKLLESNEFSDSFLVEGVMTTRTDLHGKLEFVSQKPVAARILFNRQPDGDDKVSDLRELSPDEAQALSKGAIEISPSADSTSSPPSGA